MYQVTYLNQADPDTTKLRSDSRISLSSSGHFKLRPNATIAMAFRQRGGAASCRYPEHTKLPCDDWSRLEIANSKIEIHFALK